MPSYHLTPEERSTPVTVIRIDDKYTIRHRNGADLVALRYGEYWQDLTGNGLVLAMAQRIEELETKMKEILELPESQKSLEMLHKGIGTNTPWGVLLHAQNLLNHSNST